MSFIDKRRHDGPYEDGYGTNVPDHPLNILSAVEAQMLDQRPDMTDRQRCQRLNGMVCTHAEHRPPCCDGWGCDKCGQGADR